MLKVLGGEENRKKDGYVDIHDINAYVLEQVPQEAKKHLNKYGKPCQQHPEITRMERLQGRFIVCAYDIAKAKGLGQDDTITQPPPPDTIEPVENQPNMPNITAIQNAFNQADYPTVIELLDEYFGDKPTPQYSTLKQTIEHYLNQALMPPPANLQGLKMLINKLKKQ